MATKPRKPSVWAWLIPIGILLASSYLFWVRPAQLGPPEVQIDFEEPVTKSPS